MPTNLKKDFKKSRSLSETELEKLLAEWGSIPTENHEEIFRKLDKHSSEELFLRLDGHAQAEIFCQLPAFERKSWIRILPPDDAADMIQELAEKDREHALELLDHPTRMEVLGLMAYKEDEAGGLMNSRYARLRSDMTVDEALRYLREQTRAQVETIYYAYVLDREQHLLGAISLRELFSAKPNSKVNDLMARGDDVAFIRENETQEEIARHFSKKEHKTLPVLDAEGRMKGIITLDDVVHMVQEEATEDIQKMGAVEALEEPYFKIAMLEMIRKRAGWLLVLFVGEMFTTNAMTRFQDEIAKAVVLTLFLPLVMSSGGNSGSQATTLVIRAMALGEVRLKDWARVFMRECVSGLSLGLILGIVGVARIYFWPSAETLYGPHYAQLGIAVGVSLVGIVLWGSLVGSMLPMMLKRVGIDPAVASAPFVATFVDVTGLVIYFSMANFIMQGAI
ncbi:MAG: magnesium transporter [Alphaproteobacteria bacterium]|nr:MAG: magnesium transporter [Alphaproteobacteria bacterium]